MRSAGVYGTARANAPTLCCMEYVLGLSIRRGARACALDGVCGVVFMPLHACLWDCAPDRDGDTPVETNRPCRMCVNRRARVVCADSDLSFLP